MRKTTLKLITIFSILSISNALSIDNARVLKIVPITITPFKLTGFKGKLNVKLNEKGELSTGEGTIAKITSSGQVLRNNGDFVASLKGDKLLDKGGNTWATISRNGTITIRDKKKNKLKYEWNNQGVMALGDQGEIKIQLHPPNLHSKQLASMVIALYFTAPTPSDKNK